MLTLNGKNIGLLQMADKCKSHQLTTDLLAVYSDLRVLHNRTLLVVVENSECHLLGAGLY